MPKGFKYVPFTSSSRILTSCQWSKGPVLTSSHQPIHSIESDPSFEKSPSSSSYNQPPAYKSTHRLTSPPEARPGVTSISTHRPTKSVTKPLRMSKLKALPSAELPPYEPSDSNRKAHAQSPRKHKITPRSPTQPEPHQTVLRRVQAVIHVKQEELDEESDASESKDGGGADASTANTLRRRKALSDEEYIPGEDKNGVVRIRRVMNTSVSSNEDEEQESSGDGEDDELMIGTEVCPDQIFKSFLCDNHVGESSRAIWHSE